MGSGTTGMVAGCSEDPDVKGTETTTHMGIYGGLNERCSEDPDVKGTETPPQELLKTKRHLLQRGSRCKGN